MRICAGSCLKRLIAWVIYPATATEKAKEALSSIERGDVDLVMLDLKMPGVGGLDLLKVMRRRQFPVPVIVVSGYISEDIAKALTATSVQGMVAKPFKKDRLAEELERVAATCFGA